MLVMLKECLFLVLSYFCYFVIFGCIFFAMLIFSIIVCIACSLCTSVRISLFIECFGTLRKKNVH